MPRPDRVVAQHAVQRAAGLLYAWNTAGAIAAEALKAIVKAEPECSLAWVQLSRLYAQARAHDHAALCLSGGGIRSATFGLGILQGLARCGLLDKFDYLSTVGGGGYIGSWLSAWIGDGESLDSRAATCLGAGGLPVRESKDQATPWAS